MELGEVRRRAAKGIESTSILILWAKKYLAAAARIYWVHVGRKMELDFAGLVGY